MNTGETLLVVGVVAVVGYLLYQNSKPAAAPPVQPGGSAPAQSPGAYNKYDFYSQVTREAGDVAREAIKTFGPSQTPPAARTAP